MPTTKNTKSNLGQSSSINRYISLPVLIVFMLVSFASSSYVWRLVLNQQMNDASVIAEQRLDSLEEQIRSILDNIEKGLFPLIIADPLLTKQWSTPVSADVLALLQRLTAQPNMQSVFIQLQNDIQFFSRDRLWQPSQRVLDEINNSNSLNFGNSLDAFVLNPSDRNLFYIATRSITNEQRKANLGLILDLSQLQKEINEGITPDGETILISDVRGMVVSSSNKDYMLKTFTYLPYVLRRKIIRLSGDMPIAHMGVVTVLNDNIVRMQSSDNQGGHLVNSRPLSPFNLRIHHLTSLRDLMITAFVYALLVFVAWLGAILLLLFALERRRNHQLRRRQVRLIRESEVRKNQIIEATSAGLVSFFTDGEIDTVNNAALTLFKSTDKKSLANIDSLFRNRQREEVYRLVENGQTVRREMITRRVDGSEFPADIAIRPMNTADPGLHLMTITDLSEQKETEATLKQNQKLAAMGMMSATLAHEINQPITAIKIEAKLGKKFVESESFSNAQESFAAISSHTDALAGITSQLRKFARNHRSDTNKQCDLYRLIQDIHILFKSRLEKEGIRWYEHCPDAKLVVAIDYHELYQVISNLVRNACDALCNTDKKEIHVNYRPDHEQVVIDVCDSGPGVAEDMIETVFDPFVSNKEGIQSMGLGLSICRDIMSRNNGTITVDRIRQQTQFKVRLKQFIY